MRVVMLFVALQSREIWEFYLMIMKIKSVQKKSKYPLYAKYIFSIPPPGSKLKCVPDESNAHDIFFIAL